MKMKLSLLGIVAVICILPGCADPSGPRPPNLHPSETLTSIKMNIAAAVIAVGDSIDLKATAYTLTGDTLVIPAGELQWESGDVTMLRTDQNGRMHALKSSGDNVLYPSVRWTNNGITRTSTSYVIITQNREPVTSIQIRPQGDSTRTAMPEIGLCCGISVIARSATGDSLGLIRVPLAVDSGISAAEVQISYMGPIGITLLGIGQYWVGVKRVGPLWLRAEALVYGAQMRDSIQMFGLYPLSVRATFMRDVFSGKITSVSDGNTHIIQHCGSIEFNNKEIAQPIEIIFDNPEKVSGCVPGDATGNIASIAQGATVSRKIPSGTVKWTARIKDSDPSSRVITGTVTTREP